MKKIFEWYTLEKNNNIWTIWYNKEVDNGYGSLGLYSSKRKKDCVDYCRKNNIKLEKGR